MSHEKLQETIRNIKRAAFPIILAGSSIGCAVGPRTNVSLQDCRYDSQPQSRTVLMDYNSRISLGGYLITEGKDRGKFDLYREIRNDNKPSPIEKGAIFKDVGTGRTVNITAKKADEWKDGSTELTIDSSCDQQPKN